MKRTREDTNDDFWQGIRNKLANQAIDIRNTIRWHHHHPYAFPDIEIAKEGDNTTVTVHYTLEQEYRVPMAPHYEKYDEVYHAQLDQLDLQCTVLSDDYPIETRFDDKFKHLWLTTDHEDTIWKNIIYRLRYFIRDYPTVRFEKVAEYWKWMMSRIDEKVCSIHGSDADMMISEIRMGLRKGLREVYKKGVKEWKKYCASLVIPRFKDVMRRYLETKKEYDNKPTDRIAEAVWEGAELDESSEEEEEENNE